MQTSLEVIAQKLAEKRQTDLEAILSVSGSAAIAKNEYNTTIVNDSNVASSLLFKEIHKDKYDTEELLKAVDVNIKELAPNIPTQRKDLVPKPIYDTEVSTSVDLRKQVASLNTTISDLNSQVSNLQTQIQNEINTRLVLEQTNDVVVNQLDTVGNSVGDFANQIATSLQKSVDESILRASLQSQNTGFKAQIEALIKQIDSLNSIIEGLQAQLGAVQQQQAIQQGTQAEALASGGSVINQVVIAIVKTKQDPNEKDICGKVNAAGGNKWINGEAINLTNNDKVPVTIAVSISAPPGGPNWLRVGNNNFTIDAGQQQPLTLSIDEGACANYDSKGGKSYSHSAAYEGGELKLTVTRQDGSSASKSYSMKLIKNHPSSY
jgi:chaperonin cofactor prefoldin